MTERLDEPKLENTKALLWEVVRRTSMEGNRLSFLTPPGEGEKVVQRLRVMLSRSRNKLRSKSEKFRHFKIHHSIHSYTDLAGKRHDCVVIWQSRNIRHVMMETFEDLEI